MNVGDRVTLNVDLMGFKKGAEGVVLSVLSDGTVTVEITHTPTCQKDSGLLAAQPESCFAPGANCPGQ